MLSRMAIGINDVEHLAGLARMEITDREKEGLKNDLEEILSFVSQVKEAVAEVPAPSAGALRNVFRDDRAPHEPGAFTEDLLAAAPLRTGDRIAVKKIL